MKTYSRKTIILPWLICGLGALFYAYEYFLRITPSVMTADLMRFYQIHGGSLGNLSAYYYYIYTPMQLIAGILMDRYGPRRLLTIATLCCVLGSVLFATTHFFYVAAIGRFFIGFGSAFAFVGVLKLATIWLPRRHFALFSGLATTLGMLGAVFGDVVLTKLVRIIGWQETVLLSAIFGIFLATLIGVFVQDKDLSRKATITAPTVTLKEALSGLWTIIKNPQMWIIGFIGGLYYIPASAFAELWGIPYLHNAHGFGHESAANAIAMVFLGWAFGGPAYGWLSDRIKRRKLPLTISGILSFITICFILFIPSLPYSIVVLLLFLLGAFASGQCIVFAVGRELGPNHLAASSIAFINMTVMFSGLLLQPLIGYFLDFLWKGQLSNGLHVFTVVDYQIALGIIPLTLLLGVVLSQFVLAETFCKPKGQNHKKTLDTLGRSSHKIAS